ncbi:MAG: DNA replication/repair protein RecF [Pseudomonadota bacterium]
MRLQRLTIHQLRNIEVASLSPSPRINWIIGPNASGKTTLLEGIHLLALGRSFRSRAEQRVLVRDGSDELTVFAELTSSTGIQTRIGLAKSRDFGSRLRINGETQSTLGRLVELLPVQLIDPHSHLLIAGPPSERRAFLDWGVFHVEPAFLHYWRDYRRIVRQRNALLRRGAAEREIRVWDRDLVLLAEWLTEERRSYLDTFQPLFARYAHDRFGLTGIDLRLRSGWSRDVSFADALARSLEGDYAQGHTRVGPHRADLLIRYHDQPASERTSRGQQKLIAAALRLAQVDFYRQLRHEGCVLLVDDLPSELDTEHRRALLRAIVNVDAQAFITATDSDWVRYEMNHIGFEEGVVTGGSQLDDSVFFSIMDGIVRRDTMV